MAPVLYFCEMNTIKMYEKIGRAKWVFVLLTILGCGTSATRAQEYREVTSTELASLLESTEVQLVDVRTPEEVSFGIIEGAIHVDFYDQAFQDKIQKLDKDKPVVVYCAVGGRSAKAGMQLKELGFKEIYDLQSGIRGWQQAGLPVVK